MHRRVFLAMLGSALLASRSARAWQDNQPGRPFKLKYAPHFGMFSHLAGEDPVDQLKFAADQGFTAWEDNGMIGRPVAEQERIGKAMQQLGMEWGVISALRGVWNGINFAGDDKKARETILKAMRSAVDVAERVQAKRMVVVPGLLDPKLPMDYQTANCVELLRQCCDIVEPRGLVMVLEPLNRLTNHPGVFLFNAPQAYSICRAVNRPSCKILFDIYHQQISEGNLLPNIDRCWDEIAYFQSADNPGRNEPGTGEINYRNIFAHLYAKGYRGAVGMEHSNAQDGAAGERAVIAAYRAADDFPTQSH